MFTNRIWKSRTHFRPTCLALILVFFQSSAAFGQTSTLNLSDAVNQALSNSLDAKRAVLKLDQAKINASVIDASNDPTLGLSSTWGVRWQKRTDNSPARFEEQSKIHSYGAQLRYNLLDFGRQNAKETAAGSQLKLQELAKEEADEQIFWSVVRAYQEVAANERILEITKEQLSISESRLTEQNKNYRQGLRPESDVVTAEVDVGKAKIAIQNAMNSVLLSKQDLAQLISPDSSTVSLEFSVVRGKVSASSSTSWDQLIKEIESRATEVTISQKIISANRDALKAEEDAIDSSNKPFVGAVVSAEYSGEGEWSPMRPAASGQLQLTWDVPWNGMTRLSRQSLAINRQDLEFREKDLQQTLQQSETYARTLIAQTKTLHTAMEAQAKLVNKQFQLVQNRYKVGQASALDLSTAENALVNMKLDQIRLSSNVAGAIIALAKARGVRSLEILSKL